MRARMVSSGFPTPFYAACTNCNCDAYFSPVFSSTVPPLVNLIILPRKRGLSPIYNPDGIQLAAITISVFFYCFERQYAPGGYVMSCTGTKSVQFGVPPDYVVLEKS
jgi:hypothetical protein